MAFNRYFPLLFLISVLAACSAKPPLYQAVGPAEPGVRALDGAQAMAEFQLPGAKIGYQLIELESGQILAEQGSAGGFIPASTAKMITAVAAQEILGKEFRFETRLCRADEALYLIGGGDPDLDMGDLRALAEAARGQKARHFYFDDSLFPVSLDLNPQQPRSAYYNPSVSALTTRDALLYIHWQPLVDQDEQVGLYTSPEIYSGSADVPTDWLLELKQGAKGAARFPLKDPALYTAKLFQLMARRADLDLPDPMNAAAPAGCQVIASHLSRPLIELNEQMLETSSNLQAELIGLAASRALTEERKGTNSLGESASAILAWWQAADGSGLWDDARLGNHSGLDAQARLSPRQMITVLQRSAGKPAGDSLISRLSVSGWKGWMKDRLDRPDMALRVWAKTGTMDYGVGLAGLIYGGREKPMLFSVFVSDLDARAKKDSGGTVSISPNSWNKQAKRAIDALLRGWVDRY